MSPLLNRYSVFEVEEIQNPGLALKQFRFEPYREFMDSSEVQSV